MINITAGIIYIILVLVAIAIIVGVIIYAIVYNRNANKVLRTGKPNVLLDKGPFINMFVTFGILALSIFMAFQIVGQKKQIESLDSSVNYLQTNIRSLDDEIYDLNEKLNEYFESKKDVYNINYTFGEVNTEDKRIEVKIDFSLRGYDKLSVIKVKAKNQLNSEDIVESVATGSGIFEASLNLSITGDYKLLVIEESPTTIKTYELEKFNVESYLKVNYKIDLGFPDSGKLTLRIIPEITNLPDAFKLNDVVLQIKDKDNNIVLDKSVFSSIYMSGSEYFLVIDDIVSLDYENSLNFMFTITLYNQFGKIDDFNQAIFLTIE